MKQRNIELSSENRAERIILPVNPTKFEFEETQLNQRVTLLNIGEVNLLGNRGLVTGSLSSFFPSTQSPFYRYANRAPMEYVKLLRKWKESGKPIRVIVSDSDFNLMMSIDKFTHGYKEGSGDIECNLELTEYRKLNVPAIKTTTALSRPNTKSKSKTHTVKKGDSLWAIAKKHYGNGSKYPTIYKANKSLIDKRNRQYHNAQYTIYPGQVLIIP